PCTRRSSASPMRPRSINAPSTRKRWPSPNCSGAGRTRRRCSARPGDILPLRHTSRFVRRRGDSSRRCRRCSRVRSRCARRNALRASTSTDRCGVTARSSSSRYRDRLPWTCRRAASAARTTSRSSASCCGCSGRAAARWITCGARRAAKARANGAPNGARSIATRPRPTPGPRDALRLTFNDVPMLTKETLPNVQRALTDAGVDGWLLFDFQGTNPVASGVLGLKGLVTRRVFAYIPREGKPVAITHAIEQGPWREWPADWGRERYSTWRSLEDAVATLVRGKRIAMEYSPGDAVPYVDRVPAGVIDLVRAAGADVVPSAELVTRFYALWTADQLASHIRASEIVATVGRDAIAEAGRRMAAGQPIAEHELQRWIIERFKRANLEF